MSTYSQKVLTPKRLREGFTLIEISMVILIIALVAGGLFVGKDLIESGKVKSTISTKGEFETATSIFLLKYESLPGDASTPKIPNATARTRSDGQGDNDGMIEQSTGMGANVANQCGENLIYWADLFNADLINTAGNTAVNGGGGACGYSTVTDPNQIATYLPRSAWGGSTFWFLFRPDANTRPRVHFYGLTEIKELRSSGNIFYYSADQYDAKYPVPVSAAQTIDLKLDDGLPGTGKVQTTKYSMYGNAISSLASQQDTTTCRAASGNTYRSNGTGCSMLFELNF